MKRSKFSLSHYKLFTGDMGKLIPVACYEVLPGDTIQQATSMLLRVSPLIAPVMHPVHVRIHHWFVPYRIIWPNFEPFITGGEDGMDATARPYINIPGGGYAEGSLADYLGVPPGINNGMNISALPFRAYNLIYNENYRDQDLMTKAPISKGDGLDTTTDLLLKSCAWEKDYFTTARPWTQKGPEVTMPLGTTAPLGGTATVPGTDTEFRTATGGGGAAFTLTAQNPAGAVIGSAFPNAVDGWFPGATVNLSGAYADLSSAAAVSVNQLREALAIQRYEEARARYGARYTEYLRYLGVRSSDARLQRPEYLGGGRQTIQFSEVLQTGGDGSGAQVGVGNLAGHGISAVRSNRFRRYFEEHGLVISIASVLPKTMYSDALHRMWFRVTKEDYFQRELQHIGQQEVTAKEIYAKAASPDANFGWQDRYDEYRRLESSVAGEFRTSLNHFHYARIFGSGPSLNSSFVTADPTKRVNADQSDHVLWVMANHSIQARRMVDSSATPRIS